MKIGLLLGLGLLSIASLYAGDATYNNVLLQGYSSGPMSPTLRVQGRGGAIFDVDSSGVGRLYNFSSGSTGLAFDAGLGSLLVGTYYTSTSYLSGQRSLAVGSGNYLTGNDAFAMGSQNTPSGQYSASIGYYTVASGGHSFAQGRYSGASGDGSSAMNISYTTGHYSASFNESSVAGYKSFGQGGSTVLGDYAAGFGSTTAASAYSTSVGRYNTTVNYSGGTVSGTTWNAADPVFSVGVGSGTSDRKDALTVYKGGQIRMAKRQGDILMGTFGKPSSGD